MTKTQQSNVNIKFDVYMALGWQCHMTLNKIMTKQRCNAFAQKCRLGMVFLPQKLRELRTHNSPYLEFFIWEFLAITERVLSFRTTKMEILVACPFINTIQII